MWPYKDLIQKKLTPNESSAAQIFYELLEEYKVPSFGPLSEYGSLTFYPPESWSWFVYSPPSSGAAEGIRKGWYSHTPRRRRIPGEHCRCDDHHRAFALKSAKLGLDPDFIQNSPESQSRHNDIWTYIMASCLCRLSCSRLFASKSPDRRSIASLDI